MEALHFGEGNDHPHRPPTLVVHANTREVTERSPQKWSTYLQQFHLNIKYKKGSTNNVADCLSLPPMMAITTMLNSCGYDTFDWLLLYKSNPEFSHTYQTLLEGNSSKISPLGCTTMSHGTPLCSFKRACEDDLGSVPR